MKKQLLPLAFIVGAVQMAWAGQTLPIVSAKGGSVPVNYLGWDFRNWGSTLDTSSLTDSDPSTGLTLWGLDNVQQANGINADTSAFALFTYVVPPGAPAIRFTITDEVHGTAYMPGVHIEVWRPDLGWWAQARYRDTPALPTTFSVTFDPHGNDGKYSSPADIWGSNLNNIQDSANQVMFVVYGGAALNQPGQYRLDLYEVSATVVPEPALITLVPLLGIAALQRRRRSPP